MNTTYSQQSLWSEPVTNTREFPFSWADGDVSPSQLQRLASLLIGDLQPIRDESGEHLFRIVSTRIQDGRVIGICERDSDLERDLGMLRDQPPVEDDDDC